MRLKPEGECVRWDPSLRRRKSSPTTGPLSIGEAVDMSWGIPGWDSVQDYGVNLSSSVLKKLFYQPLSEREITQPRYPPLSVLRKRRR